MPEQVQITETQRYDPVVMNALGQQDFLKYKTNMNDLLNTLYKSIAGVEWDKNQKMFIKLPYAEPLANINFIRKLYNIILAYCGNHSIHANLTEKECHEYTKMVCKKVIFLIVQCSDEYEIREENYDMILAIVEGLVFFSLSRAKNGAETASEAGMYKINEVSNSRLGETNVKSGIWGRR